MAGKVEIPIQVAEAISRLKNMGFSDSAIVNFVGDHRKAKNKALEHDLKTIRNWAFAHPENTSRLVEVFK